MSKIFALSTHFSVIENSNKENIEKLMNGTATRLIIDGTPEAILEKVILNTANILAFAECPETAETRMKELVSNFKQNGFKP